MAAARIRRAFRYLDDSELEHEGRNELDDEEQERLIKELRIENDKQNSRYYLFFTILPMITAITYAPSILSPSPTAFQRLAYLLCVLSLFATAYIMRFLPLERSGRKHNKAISTDAKSTLFINIKKYLAAVNVCICTLLSVTAWKTSNDLEEDHLGPIFYLIPAVMLGVVMIARRTILDVDIGQLEGLRYEYKGA